MQQKNEYGLGEKSETNEITGTKLTFLQLNMGPELQMKMKSCFFYEKYIESR